MSRLDNTEAPIRGSGGASGQPFPRAAVPGRRILIGVSALALSCVLGAALVRFQLELIAGGAIVAFFVAAVLTRPFLGLVIYTVIFLVRPAELYPQLAPLHLERVVGMVSLVGMFAENYFKRGRLLVDRTRPTLLFLLLLGVALLSVAFAYWRRAALEGVIELSKILVFYILIVHLLNTRLRLRVFVWLFCGLTVYTVATSLMAYLKGDIFYAQGVERAVGRTLTADNPNTLATTLAAALPFFLLLGFCRSLRWSRSILLLAAPGVVATMALTGSRGSLLGFLGSSVFLWLTSRRRALVGLLGIPLLVGGFFLLPAQYKARYSTITSQDLDASSQARIRTWKAGAAMVVDRPLLGVGMSCFGTAHATAYSPEDHRSWLQPHSLYIQVPAELGLLGALVFFGFLVESFRLNQRTRKGLSSAGVGWEFERALLRALLAGFVALLIAGFFGHSLLRRTWYLYSAMGVGVFRLYSSSEEALDASRRPTSST